MFKNFYNSIHNSVISIYIAKIIINLCCDQFCKILYQIYQSYLWIFRGGISSVVHLWSLLSLTVFISILWPKFIPDWSTHWHSVHVNLLFFSHNPDTKPYSSQVFLFIVDAKPMLVYIDHLLVQLYCQM